MLRSRALGLKHVTKVTASRDAMLINIERLGPARITELFEEPPNPPAQPAGFPELYVPAAAEAGGAGGASTLQYESFARRFGELDVEMPDERPRATSSSGNRRGSRRRSSSAARRPTG
eukprot:1290033-Prymnesium_polylepis.1